MLARLLEEVPHPRRADADDHLHELRGAHREERHAGLSCDRLREQRLSCARRADQQHAFRSGAAQSGVLLRVFEKIHDLDQFVLGFVDAGDVVEGDLGILLLVVAARLALADAHEPAAHPAALLRRAPKHPDIKADEEQRRAKAEKKRRQGTTAFLDRFGADLDPVIDQKGFQTGIDKRRAVWS